MHRSSDSIGVLPVRACFVSAFVAGARPSPGRSSALFGMLLGLLVLLAGAGRAAHAQAGRSPTPATPERPRVRSVSPRSVVGSTADQWLTLHGSGFARGFTVRLRSEGVDAHITVRRRLDFVSAREVRVEATFGASAAPWTTQVINPDSLPKPRHSNVYTFEVVAPTPRIEVMRPVERTAGQAGFSLTVYGKTLTSSSVIRWNGADRPTTPITTSDNPNALTVGLKAKIPAAAIAEQGRNAVRIYTPPPGGGLSPPTTLFANPRPFYRTLWFYLLLVAGMVLGGYALYRWRLKKLHEHELERQVDTRTEQLQQEKEKTERQAERLRELDQAKNRFLTNLSHEFRTPLTMIAPPLRDVLTASDDALPVDVRKRMQVAVRNAGLMEHLVEQLLDLSRMEAGQLSLERCRGDLTRFAQEVVRSFAPLAERREIRLRFRAGTKRLPAAFDPEKLRTVLGNLLSNALKFTPAGGKVLVRTTAAGDEAVLRVSDTGPGIPREELPRIFDRFHQVDGSTTRESEGVGIGLALAKELVELHGGAIRAESEPGLGTTFVVTLPVRPLDADGRTVKERLEIGAADPTGRGDGVPGDEARARLPEPQAPPLDEDGSPSGARPSPPDTARPTLLVVEDSADVRAYLNHCLAGNYRIVEAHDGAEALEKLRSDRPDLVLSDVMMPKLDGAQLCRRLKADEELGDLPVILLTAKAGEAAQVKGLDAGADAYVEKPFSMEALCARIRNLIENRRTLRTWYSDEVVMQPSGVSVTSEEEAFFEEARAVVEVHLGASDFTVEHFAAEMNLTKGRLTRRLKEATGLTPARFARRMRLERAARLLEQDPGLRVYEVAGAVGYCNADSFSKRFREHFGVPPSQYPPENGAQGARAA